MDVIPVLDILEGNVVRAIAGRRDSYRPIMSRLTQSHAPLEVANAIRDKFGLSHFYVADLDGILKQQPNYSLYARLIANGFQLLIDPGIRSSKEAEFLSKQTVAGLIVGLETCRSPTELMKATDAAPNITFSLDLCRGVPRRHIDATGWNAQAEEIVHQVINCGVNRIIVLDLSDVGMGTGGSTDSLCQKILTEFPKIRLIAGGGVRSADDVRRLSDIGVGAVLVGSALHDGLLSRDDLSR